MVSARSLAELSPASLAQGQGSFARAAGLITIMQPGYLVFLNMAVSIITFFIHMLTVFVQIDFSLKHQNAISKKILYILSVELGIMWSSEHTSF